MADTPPAPAGCIALTYVLGNPAGLVTRNGKGFTRRFPAGARATVTALPVRSCLLDGKAIVCNESSLRVFDLIRRARRKVRRPTGTIERRASNRLLMA
jgi:ATP-dependent DNA ligase